MSNFEHVAAASLGASAPRPGPRRNNIPFVARTLLRILQRLDSGHLGITLPDGEHRAFTGARPGAVAELHIHDWKAIGILLRKGDIGLAECWRDGRVTTPDMTAFLALCAANQGALEAVFYGHPAVAAFFRLLHRLRPNTRAGSRRNITRTTTWATASTGCGSIRRCRTRARSSRPGASRRWRKHRPRNTTA